MVILTANLQYGLRDLHPWLFAMGGGGLASDAEPTKHFAAVEDATLVGIAQRDAARAQQAFSELVRRHQHWLVGLVAYLLGRQDVAEDVAQDVFLRAFIAIDSFRGEASFRGWLRTIAMRQAFNRRRNAATRERYKDLFAREQEESVSDASLLVDEEQRRQQVGEVLATLDYHAREILVLRYVEELSLKEIAAMLELGLSAAKMRLSRAREAFREHLMADSAHDALAAELS